MATGIDPKVDYVFKCLCGDEDNALLLVDLLNAVLRFPVGRVVSGVTQLNPFVAKDDKITTASVSATKSTACCCARTWRFTCWS
jgi:hypothetical protein